MASYHGKLFLAAAFVLAGSSVVSLKYLAVELGPFTIISTSLFLSLLFVLPFLGVELVRVWPTLNRRTIVEACLQALFGVFLFRLLLLAGLARTSAGEAGLLIGATPALTALLAWLVIREPLTGRSIGGIFCAVTGIAVLQNWSSISYNSAHILGNIMVLGAAASESVFNAASRKSGREDSLIGLSPLGRTLMVCTMALFLCLGPALTEKPWAALAGLEAFGWAAMIWQALFVTILAYYLWFKGIERCDAYTAAAFSGLMPLSSVVLAITLLDETLSLNQILGGLFIGAAMLVIGTGSADQELKKVESPGN